MYAPISNGELLDKYSILLIKKENIKNQEKIEKINNEISCLINHVNNLKEKFNIDNLFTSLLNVNKKLWNIEDNIRIKEKKQEFDEEFISIARNVYFSNDIRANIKKQINKITNSVIEEVKSYEDYKN